jgi:hypothetical protein
LKIFRRYLGGEMTDFSEVRTPKFLPRKTRLALGLDPAQARDRVAICVIEYCTGVLDEGSDMERHCDVTAGLGLQKTGHERWRVIHMERLPLNTKYGDIVRHVAGILAVPQLQADRDKNRSKCDLVIDFGGIGRAVAETALDNGLDPVCVQSHGGLDTKWARKNTWNVPKHELITRLDARLKHDRFPLTFSTQLVEGEAFKQEIADFEANVRAAGRMQYEAKAGKHDDMISATALAVWWLSRPPPAVAAFTTYGYAKPGESTQNSYPKE